MEFFLEQITYHKNFTFSLFMAVQDLIKDPRYKIHFTHISFQKIILVLNNKLTLTFMLVFSKNDMVKLLIQPAIASLNDYLAVKMQTNL